MPEAGLRRRRARLVTMRPGTETNSEWMPPSGVRHRGRDGSLPVRSRREFVQLSRVEFLRRRESDDVDGLAVTGDVLGREAAEMKKFGNAFFEPRRIRW